MLYELLKFIGSINSIAAQKINTAAKHRLPFCKKIEFLEMPNNQYYCRQKYHINIFVNSHFYFPNLIVSNRSAI
jgi:hypothetical protein